MKRICLLVVALTLAALPALGEQLDFSSMSLDELQALHEKLDAEIASRTECTTPEGYNGLLVGGKNITPGGYKLTCLEGEITIYVWKFEGDYYLDNSKGYAVDYNQYIEGDTVLMFFNEGTTVLIEGGTVAIQPADEEWVPQL